MTCQSTLPITVTVNVADPDTVLLSFDQIQIHRSTDGESGVYVEVTTEDTRLNLESGTTVYEYIDESGSGDYWYRWRYYNSTTMVAGPLSSPAPGATDPVLDIITIEELKTNYLFGLDLTRDDGTEYPDSLYLFFIKSAISQLEHKLDIDIVPKTYVAERHDYYREDYDKYIWIELDHFPVIGVSSVQLVLPGEQVVQVFENDWIHIQRQSGQLQLVPGTGTAGSILLGASGAWIPLIYGNNRFIPDVFRVTYESGFGTPSDPNAVTIPNPRLDDFPDIMIDVIGKIASFGPLNIAGDLLGGAGIASQSIGIDGLSQSFNTTSSATNAGYGARLLQYSKELKEVIPMLIRYYKGLRMQVV